MSSHLTPIRSLSARQTAAVVAAAVLGLGALAGCSGSVDVGSTTVDRADVEKEAATQLAATVDNGTVPDISCPDDLEAEVDATLTCDLTVEGDDAVYPVTITVTSVQGKDVEFDVQVAEEPAS